MLWVTTLISIVRRSCDLSNHFRAYWGPLGPATLRTFLATTFTTHTLYTVVTISALRQLCPYKAKNRRHILRKYPPMIIRRALWRVRNTDDRWHAIRMSRAGAKCSDPSGASRQGGVRHTPSRRVPPGASNFAEWPVRRSRNLKV